MQITEPIMPEETQEEDQADQGFLAEREEETAGFEDWSKPPPEKASFRARMAAYGSLGQSERPSVYRRVRRDESPTATYYEAKGESLEVWEERQRELGEGIEKNEAIEIAHRKGLKLFRGSGTEEKQPYRKDSSQELRNTSSKFPVRKQLDGSLITWSTITNFYY